MGAFVYLMSMGVMMGRIAVIGFAILLTVINVSPMMAGDEADDFSKRGVQTLVAGDAQQAMELLSRAIDLNPSEYRYYNDRGVAFKRLDRLDSAIEDYTRALEIKADFTNALNNRGVAYLEKGMHDKAVSDFAKALELGDTSSKIYTNRGLAYALMDDQAKALADFKNAVAIRPTDSRAFVFAGDTLLKLGDKIAAFEMYQLAAGVVKDENIAEQIEKRLSSLEKQVFTQESLRGPQSSGKVDAATRKDQSAKAVRSIHRDRNGHAQNGTRDRRPLAASASYSKAREAIVKRLRPEAAELYRRGEEFMQKSDAPKALLMYEDALQLARRHHDKLSEAWTLVEIGRCHAAIGDQFVGARYIEQAISRFDQLKAVEEKNAALTELTSIRKPGGPDRAPPTPRAPERVAKSNGAAAARTPSKAVATIPPPSPTSTDQSAKRSAASPQKPTSPDDKTAAIPPPPEAKTAPKEVSKPTQPPVTVPDRSRGRRTQRVDPVGQEIIRQVLKRSRAKAIETAPGTLPSSPAPAVQPAPASVASAPSRTYPAEGFAKRGKSLDELLGELKKLKAARNERDMVGVLEALASEYEKSGKQDTALVCLTASVAYRDKLSLADGIEMALLQRGKLKEKAGRMEEALADFTRALRPAQKEKKSDLVKFLSQRAESLAKKSGLEPKAALDAFAGLWKARDDGDEESEVRALRSIAVLYEHAGQAAPAAEYYARTAALMAAQRASLLRKAGKPAEAEESIKQALGEFKTLDYSRYLLIMKKSKEPGPLSRHD